MGKMRRAIGLMSGTSMDGIDVALLETDGDDRVVPGPSATYAYDDRFRRALAGAVHDAQAIVERGDRPGQLAAVENELTVRHADAVAAFQSAFGIGSASIDLVGFHGQTVLHRPESGLTVQLGDGARLARLIGCPVYYDLRAADVAAGGQGAPLAPVYHKALLGGRPDAPTAILNIGGVTNVTWVGPDGDLIAFDTGPGNALIDDWMLKRTRMPMDRDGQVGLAGKVSESVVDFFLDHDYFARSPPKSLDRNAFFWDLIEGLDVADGAATLAAMTAGAVARACDHLPDAPRKWIVCGGGRHNRAIMRQLRDRLTGRVCAAEEMEFRGDAIEAEAWAYLAVRSADGEPITFPGTTGVLHPLTGGIRATP